MTATDTSAGSVGVIKFFLFYLYKKGNELHRDENGLKGLGLYPNFMLCHRPGTDAPFRGERTCADPVHDMVQSSAGIPSRRCLSFPEVSSGVRTHVPRYIPGHNATSSSLSTQISYKHPSESGMPPASRHRQRSQPHTGPLQNHPPTAPVVSPPQNSYRTPHQGASGILAPALTESAHPTSAPPAEQHGGIMGHQRTQPDVHPHPHAVQSPPFSLPRHHIQDNIHHPGYISPPMMTALPPHAPVYQYGTPPVLVPTAPPIFPPSVSAPTSPIYLQTNTSPPPHSPSTLRHSMSDPISSLHHSTPYAMHVYTPMGYPTSPSYAYPSPASFVPAPPIYGSHCPLPHYSRPHSFPTGQESQGTWSHSPPVSPVALNSFGGTQREFQPAGYPPVGQLYGKQPEQPNTVPAPSNLQPTRPTNRTRASRPLNEVKREAAQSAPSPTSPTSSRNKHQERRPYHPNPPAQSSEWVMWAGNVPSDVTQDELRDFLNQPLSSAESGPTKDGGQQVYGGVSTVFLILRSNCAFANFDSEAQLEAATARFNGRPIRPGDPRCQRLVCRVRRREDELMAGVGAQRGNGVHTRWVKEQKVMVQREQTDTVASQKSMVRSSSSLSVLSDDNGGIGEGHVSTHANLSRSVSSASTNSDILTRYFPQRYFILKSSTQYDLDVSVQKNIWATQRHNQEILDQAYRTSKDVFLIFSVNKSGEFYGYARMAGPVLRDEIKAPWPSATGSTPPPSSGSSSSELSAGSSPSPDDTGAERPGPLYIIPPDEHQQVAKQTPHSAPAGRPSFTLAESQKPYDRLAFSMPNTRTSPGPAPPHALDPIPASSSNLSSEPLLIDLSTRCTSGSAGDDVEQGVSEDDVDDKLKPVSEMSRDGTGSAWDRPFRIEWIRTDPLPFFRTRHVRNAWNHGREVKVSRDGTELEPLVGRQLLDEWDRPFVVAIDKSPGPSRNIAPERRRAGAKSAKKHPQ